MSGRQEIIHSRAGVTLSRTVAPDGDIYTVTSKWGAQVRTFALWADAEACFDAQVALAPQRPSLYGDRYKET